MQPKKICNKQLMELIREHVIFRRKFGNESLDPNEIQKEVKFVFNAIRKEEKLMKEGIELSAGGSFTLADNKTLVKYLGSSGKEHFFEIGELTQSNGRCHFRYPSYPEDSVMLLNNSWAYKVKGNSDTVILHPTKESERDLRNNAR